MKPATVLSTFLPLILPLSLPLFLALAVAAPTPDTTAVPPNHQQNTTTTKVFTQAFAPSDTIVIPQNNTSDALNRRGGPSFNILVYKEPNYGWDCSPPGDAYALPTIPGRCYAFSYSENGQLACAIQSVSTQGRSCYFSTTNNCADSQTELCGDYADLGAWANSFLSYKCW